MDKSLVWYLTGPISGIPRGNIPLFESATAVLRASGYKIISPIEADGPEIHQDYMIGKVHDHRWGEFLARDVKIIADDVDGLILLPGWQGSRGARLEVFTGILCQKAFGLYDSSIEAVLETDIIHMRLWLRSTM